MSSPECTSGSIPVINDTPGEALPTPVASMEPSGAFVDAGIPRVLRLAPIPLAGPVDPGPGDDDDDDDEGEDGGGSGGNIDPDDDEGYDDEDDDDDDDEEPLRCAPSPR